MKFVYHITPNPYTNYKGELAYRYEVERVPVKTKWYEIFDLSISSSITRFVGLAENIAQAHKMIEVHKQGSIEVEAT